MTIFPGGKLFAMLPEAINAPYVVFYDGRDRKVHAMPMGSLEEVRAFGNGDCYTRYGERVC